MLVVKAPAIHSVNTILGLYCNRCRPHLDANSVYVNINSIKKCFSSVNDDVSTAYIVIIPKGQKTQKGHIMLYFVRVHYT